jgi:hypothetical protein
VGAIIDERERQKGYDERRAAAAAAKRSMC